jgi:hypothetical protein
MSLSFQKLNPVLVRDPRTILENTRDYAILKSGSQTTWKAWTTTSISQSSMQFSCPPPSGSVIVDRKIYFYLTARLVFTGIPPVGQSIIMPNRDAPRAYPIASSIDTLQISINNQSVSMNMADIIQALLHFNTDARLKNHDYSMTPTYPDQSQNYSDLFGDIRNPLASYGDANDESVTPRGGFPFVIVSNPIQAVAGTTLTAIVDCAFCEPLWLSPFYFGCENGSGFYNVNTMDFNISFLNQLGNRLWSHDSNGGTNVISSVSVAFGGQVGGPTSFGNNTAGPLPLMLIQYITPQETQILSPNMALSYSYFDINRYPTDYGSAVPAYPAPASTITISSSNIQLSSVPRRLYIYVRQRNADLYASPSNTDTYFQISNVNIQFLNKSGLLSNATPQQLYEMSVKNHCNMSWTQWSGGPVYPTGAFPNPPFPPPVTPVVPTLGTIGGIVAVEFASDIGLESLMCPGVLSQCMLQVTVTATNISNNPTPISPTLYLVPVLEGVFCIEGLGRAGTQIGVISSQDILDAQSSPFISYNDVQSVNGGDIWSGLKDFGQKLLSGLRTAHDFIKEHKLLSTGLSAIPHPIAQTASKVAQTFGYGEGGVANSWTEFLHEHGHKGYSREQLVRMYHQQMGSGEGMHEYGRGVLVGGGARMSRNSLRDRLR